MKRLRAATSIVLGLIATTPLSAQQRPLYVRIHNGGTLPDRVPPYASGGMTEPLTREQQLAIAPVKYPAIWPAPNVPPGTVLMVPPRPKGLPGPGEYWGPFTNDLGGWGFMIGPIPPPPAPQMVWPDFFNPRQRFTLTPPPPPPPPPVPPVAGPISPDGRMVVTYADGNQVTWQFPMVVYQATFNGIGPGGGFRLTDQSGRRGTFGVARNARFTLNGQPVAPRNVPVGVRVTARALQMTPHVLSVLEFTR
jgi:hypothetical protein